MKKLYIALVVAFSGYLPAQSYWQKLPNETNRKNGEEQYYKLNISTLRKQLKATETSKNKYVIIEVPNLEGKMEKFRVKSFPVMDEALAAQYQLGSYIGTSLSNPYRTIRFSVSPDDFQSMISNNGKYQFIDPERSKKESIKYTQKTRKTHSGKAFECSTEEHSSSKNELNRLYEKANQSLLRFTTANDKKYRTLRIAISTTGEYTQVFGGRDKALQQINATLTRVNGIYEQDLAVHFNLVNKPELIYTDPATDPYSDADRGAGGNWSLELQKNLTKELGEDNYDIGHLFGASGGGGNGGCLGCICTSPKMDANGIPVENGKGSAYTSPAVENEPYGDSFDIDFVAHEIGHQMGANHTFAFKVESSQGVQIEPGSGSTIMGYAGVAGPSVNVQDTTDPYFSIASLNQIQTNLNDKKCVHEADITKNTPPTITPLTPYTVPKGTPFILTAKATDKENDPISYTWEQTDAVDKEPLATVSGDNVKGPNFRSLPPSPNPTRYFPRLESVIAGKLVDRANWESVSNVAREMNFAVTVRDHHSDPTQQQVASAKQTITISDDGPFKVTNTKLYYNTNRPITWDVANTDKAPYNVSNVKIDYTTDKGKTWVVLAASTPNDGSEQFNFPTTLHEKEVQIRVTAIDNIFYTISSPLLITKIATCDNPIPNNFVVSTEEKLVNLSWEEVLNATYVVRYKKKDDTNWTEIKNINELQYTLNSPFTPDTVYEVQVGSVCSGTTHFTNSKEFSFAKMSYCPLTAKDATLEYISKVEIKDAGGNTILSNSSDGKGYSDFTNDSSKLVALKRGSKGNKMKVTVHFPDKEDYYETLSAWIDFNGDGKLTESERIVTHFIPDPSNGNVGSVDAEFTFDVPADANINEEFLRLRISLKVGPSINSAPAGACDGKLKNTLRSKNRSVYEFGEVEDYRVKFTP